MRIVGVEPLLDELRVVLVLGEDDGLAQPVAARHLQPVGHQVRQHLVDRVVVEQPLVDRLGARRCRAVPSSSHSSASHCSFSSSRQVVVADALALELERHRDGLRRHEEAVLDRLVER